MTTKASAKKNYSFTESEVDTIISELDKRKSVLHGYLSFELMTRKEKKITEWSKDIETTSSFSLEQMILQMFKEENVFGLQVRVRKVSSDKTSSAATIDPVPHTRRTAL